MAVNPETALSLAAVYRSASIIGITGSQLPLVVRRGDQVLDVPLVQKPDINIPAYEFYFQTIVSLALFGNAYWYVTRNTNGQAQNLTVLDPKAVTLVVEDMTRGIGKKLRYEYAGATLKNSNIQHLRLFTMPASYTGLGPIQAARLDIATALRIREFGDGVLATGGVPTGILSSDQFLTQDQADGYREAWDAAQRERGLAVLGAGLSYSPITLSPADIQFLENQMFSVSQVGRLFGIPATWLGVGIEGSSITYSTSEDLARVFIQTTLTQYLTAIESAMEELLPRGQKCSFKMDALLRADIKSRVAAYQALVGIGAMTPDEVRKSEGLDGTSLTNDGSPI